jgi:hypothetical protein
MIRCPAPFALLQCSRLERSLSSRLYKTTYQSTLISLSVLQTSLLRNNVVSFSWKSRLHATSLKLPTTTNALTAKSSLTNEETYLCTSESTLGKSPTHARTVRNGSQLLATATITKGDIRIRSLIAATYAE